MISSTNNQYPDLQVSTWSNDFDGDNYYNVSDSLNFEPNLLNAIEKQHYTELSDSSNSNSNSNSISGESTSSSFTSASSYNDLIDPITNGGDLLVLNQNNEVYDNPKLNYHNYQAHNNDTINSMNGCVYSCFSPTLINESTTNLNDWNQTNNNNNYTLRSNSHQFFSNLNNENLENNVKVKQEYKDILEENKLQEPIEFSSTVLHKSDSPNLTVSELSTPEHVVKKRRESKSTRRVKKPMTLVQRKAHNKIERKYRININSKIANLQKLVPWMSEDGVAFEIYNKHGNSQNEENEESSFQPSSKRLNKSMILDMVTEYLLLLKEECKKKDGEIEDLKNQLNSHYT